MIFTTIETMQTLRARLRAGEGSSAALSAWLREKADEAAAAPTACITDRPSPAVSGDPHDYFSEGPYWWPDPKNPDGPYIRRDGYVNPDRFGYHFDALQAILRHSLTLTMAAYHLDEPRYAEAARDKLRRFFLDPATRMNPHLDYAQAIRGITPGRGIGIIDATGITRLVFAVEILELIDPADETAAGVKEWLSAFYHWMRTSKNGIDEKYNGNNHSTYYTVMTASLARLLGDGAGFDDDCAYFAEMMRKQMAGDGSFPAETARTNSFGYSCMNLGGFALLCEVAHFAGVDLWNRDCGGARMSTAIAWLAQYIADPEAWPYPTIHKGGDAPLAMLAASARLKDEAARAAAEAAFRSRNQKNANASPAMQTASARPEDGGAHAAAEDALRAALAEDPLREISPFGPAALWFAR